MGGSIEETNAWAQKQTEKLEETKQNFSDTMAWILQSRTKVASDVFNKLPQLGAMNMMLSDPEYYKDMLSKASGMIKDHPGLKMTIEKLASLLEDWTISKWSEDLNTEIFSKSLDKEEVNDYLAIIGQLVDEILNEYISYVDLAKQADIAEIKRNDMLMAKIENNEDDDKKVNEDEWEKTIASEEKAFNEFKEKHIDLSEKNILKILVTIILGMKTETNPTDDRHPSWLSLTERSLESIIGVLCKYAENSDVYKLSATE